MKVFIGNAIWREVDAEHAHAMKMLSFELLRAGHTWMDGSILGDALVSRARAIAASNFLRSDADVFLSVDSDIVFDPADAIRLCEQAVELGHMIGGVYVTRGDSPRSAVPLPEEIVFADDQPLVETRWLSTGFMAIPRVVVETMTNRLLTHLCAQESDQPWYPYFDPFDVPDPKAGRMYLSEDWAFCERAKSDGFKCFIDPTIRLGHKASLTLYLEDMLRPARSGAAPMMVQTYEDGSFQCFVQKGVSTMTQELPQYPGEAPVPTPGSGNPKPEDIPGETEEQRRERELEQANIPNPVPAVEGQ